jgi:peptide-methionine (S)-S-oxide reductase
MKNTLLITALVLITNCTNAQKYSEQQNLIINSMPVEVNTKKIHKAYFASGCFWCVEAIYESIIGVNEVISGYSGGFTSEPTYDIVNTQTTGHAETIEVIYNPKLITFSQLVDVYFGTQNVEQINGQGPDNGTQYRSIIFYQNENQKDIINKKIQEITETLKVSVAAESYPFLKFWKAEKYHQDFKKNNKFNSYIINVSDPRFKRFKYKFSEIINQNQ